MIELRAVNGPTPRMLRELLGEKGITFGVGRADAVVSYGMQVNTQLPALNARAGRDDKLQQLKTLHAKHVRVVPYAEGNLHDDFFPAYGRKLRHSGGRDIAVFCARDQIFSSLARRFDYFTKYVPWRKEWRVWAYRRRPLALYEKVLTYPERVQGAGANWANGFAFEFRQGEEHAAVKSLGALAVDALGLDFGAVDILEGLDGHHYVLEVNCAPGAEGPRQGLVSLANKIAKWVQLGYPRRRGDER